MFSVCEFQFQLLLKTAECVGLDTTGGTSLRDEAGGVHSRQAAASCGGWVECEHRLTHTPHHHLHSAPGQHNRALSLSFSLHYYLIFTEFFCFFRFQNEEMSLRDAASSFITELFTCTKEGGTYVCMH